MDDLRVLVARFRAACDAAMARLAAVPIDNALEVHGRDRSHVSLDHDARRIHDRRGRQSFERFKRHERTVADQQTWEVDTKRFEEAPRLGGCAFLEVDADDLHVGVGLLIPDQLGQLPYARGTPGCPEIHHHPASTIVRETHCIAAQVVEREVDRLGVRNRMKVEASIRNARMSHIAIPAGAAPPLRFCSANGDSTFTF